MRRDLTSRLLVVARPLFPDLPAPQNDRVSRLLASNKKMGTAEEALAALALVTYSEVPFYPPTYSHHLLATSVISPLFFLFTPCACSSRRT
jgi:hypothetical protein